MAGSNDAFGLVAARYSEVGLPVLNPESDVCPGDCARIAQICSKLCVALPMLIIISKYCLGTNVLFV